LTGVGSALRQHHVRGGGVAVLQHLDHAQLWLSVGQADVVVGHDLALRGYHEHVHRLGVGCAVTNGHRGERGALHVFFEGPEALVPLQIY